MGSGESKLNFRKAVVQLTTKLQPVEAADDEFWNRFWSENISGIQDFFALIPAAEIRALREESPSNIATLCYKAIEKLVSASNNIHLTDQEQLIVLNCVRLLTRVLPYIFEDPDWDGFFWSKLPDQEENQDKAVPLAQSLIISISNLLFCPDFTAISAGSSSASSKPIDSSSFDSCEFIWEAGVGFPYSPPSNGKIDQNRTELLKLLLTCFSETMYTSSTKLRCNRWIECFCSSENTQALPLFVSLLNVVCAYNPTGFGVPYNYMFFEDYREALVEVASQLLIVTLDQNNALLQEEQDALRQEISRPNLFINYLSRIHRDEDFNFILSGICRLLNNPIQQTYLPGSMKRINFHQELMVLFWRICDINKKFLFFTLKSSEVLSILVPILYHLNDARADQSRIGLIHIGVFILLLLSGERNFGVRLNKPFTAASPTDVPVFSGTHADFLILVFHRVITAGHQRLQPLYDCLLTIIVNISPYLKSISMTTATKLLHLLEAFSTPWFLFSAEQNHHLVFFLLEIFNNVIQYQFDGNYNLIYTIIRKRHIFHQLANLPTDSAVISNGKKHPNKKQRFFKVLGDVASGNTAKSTETISTSLAQTPDLDNITSHVNSDDTTLQNPYEVERPSNSNEQEPWKASRDWIDSWKSKLPLQTIMRMLQVLVPQVEKICIDKNLTDESEILKFLQHGTLVGLLPVPHPILIRKYQSNVGTSSWFCTYMWGVIYLRNIDPPIWYDTDVKLFDIQRV